MNPTLIINLLRDCKQLYMPLRYQKMKQDKFKILIYSLTEHHIAQDVTTWTHKCLSSPF